MLTSKVDVDRLSEVRDLSSYHVGRLVSHVALTAVLTSESLCVFYYLASAVVRKAGGIEDSVIVLDAAYVTIQKEEVIRISVVLVLNTVVDLTDQVEVA